MSNVCAICLDEIDDDFKKVLPCDSRHSFHKLCVDEWLTTHNNCPICRAAVPRPSRPILRPLSQTQSSDSISRIPISPLFMIRAYRLGLPPIEHLPFDPYNMVSAEQVHIHNNHLYDDIFGITTRNAVNWFPQDWLDFANRAFPPGHSLHHLYNVVNSGVSTHLITRGYSPPTGLNICPLCGGYVTNVLAAMQGHYRKFHGLYLIP